MDMNAVYEDLHWKQIFPYRGTWPRIAESAFIAAGAMVSGDVEIGPESGVWFNVVVRGDVNYVRIGARTNIQDGTVIHVERAEYPTLIGDEVTIGHKAIVHACTLEDGAFVGMGATVMDGAVVEGGGMVAAGALLTPGKRVRAGEIWAGSPAKYMRAMSEDEKAHAAETIEVYCRLAREYRAPADGT